MSNWDYIDPVDKTLETELDNFKTLMKNAVDPTTWDAWRDQWAAEHDDNMNYDGNILNIDKKHELDKTLEDYTGDNSYAQQQLHLLEESKPTNEEESEIKETAITYIKTWLELMHTEYNNFLDSVTLDEETLSEKWDLIRENLKDNYYSDIRSEYMSVMQEYEAWTDDDVQEWYENDGQVPEDFVSDYLNEI